MSLVDVVAGDNTFGIDIVLSDTSDKIDQYDTIPLEKISEGPGTRCLIDSIDYGVALQSEDLDLFSLSGSESLEVASPSGGGCQLAINGRTNYWAILIFLGLIVFIGGLRMKRHIFWVLILSTLFLSSVAMATSVVPVDLKTLATKAEKIFYGRCADVDVQEDENGLRSTYVTFEIERGVKGADGNAVTFKIFGEAPKEGNGFSTGIIGMPHFQEGDLHVLFLYPESAGGYTSPVGLGQGSFRAVETEAGPKLVNKKLSVQDKTMKEVVGNDVPETPDELLDRVEDLLN